MRMWLSALLLGWAVAVVGCEPDGASGDTPAEPYTNFFSPLPAQAHYPADNPFSEDKRRLGEFLFWDPILSGKKNVACASCHHPDFGWADGRPKSVGVDGVGLGPNRSGSQHTEVHSPTVLNVAFAGLEGGPVPSGFVSGPYFWDLRADTLEEQAAGPIRNAVEMRSELYQEDEIMPVVIERLAAITEYVDLFEAAFAGPDSISEANLARALATFQRSLITSPTRFDQFIAGDDSALSGREITGLNKFVNGGCADCHSGPLLSDFAIHEDEPVLRDFPAVRTPSLRNVELTAPYMHDGSKTSLRSAISVYEDRDDLDVTLDDDDFGDIERFLRTLTDDTFDRSRPDYVPSQLPVGGDIF